MRRIGLFFVSLIVLAAIGALVIQSMFGEATIKAETPFVVSSGSSLTAVAAKLEEEGLIASADGFLLRAKLLGSDDPIQAGEFALTPDMSQADILAAFQSGDVIRRFITIPEGMPSIIVHQTLMEEELLTGEIPVPAEGSILPQTYDFERGQSRAALLDRMTSAMTEALADEWAKRGPDAVVTTPEEAVILASIVEKETGVPEERRMVAGLYSNRVRTGMRLQADPTIIYPLTKGRPLGRRIRRSEIDAVNGYNTYTRNGLPIGPITNPGRESIAAVLNPAKTSALFMVADGTGGHAFGETLAEHEANVEKWYNIRRERGEM